MMRDVEMSVIMTVYNGEDYLQDAIDSILAQTYKNFEFVIVDDGSTDGTPLILENARNDLRIKVLTTQRLGRSKALNLAWRNAQGKYIANLDADDMSEPTRLEKQMAFLRSNPNVGLVGTAWKIFDNNDMSRYTTVHPPLTDRELRTALIRRYPFYHSSTTFTRDALEGVGGYNEGYRVAIDYEISARIAACFELANLPDVLTWQRIHENNYFSGISSWRRYVSVIKIRTGVWNKYSRNPIDLIHVYNGWGIFKEFIGSLLNRIIER